MRRIIVNSGQMEGRGLCAAPDNAAKQILATAIVSPSHQLSYYNGNHTVS